jgi:hypothetical protein
MSEYKESLKDLDKVLTLMYERNKSGSIPIYHSAFIKAYNGSDVQVTDIGLMIHHLCDLGYAKRRVLIDEEQQKSATPSFIITAKGKMFHQKGGFKKEKRVNTGKNILKGIGYVALIVGIIWSCIQIYKFYFPEEDPCVVPEWIREATLHKASMDQWMSGTQEDKTGTCGAFLILARSPNLCDPELLKVEATELSLCIDRTWERDSTLHSFKSPDVGSICLVTFFGYD